MLSPITHLVLLGVRVPVEGEVDKHEGVPETRVRVHELAPDVLGILDDGEQRDAGCATRGGGGVYRENAERMRRGEGEGRLEGRGGGAAGVPAMRTAERYSSDL